MSLRTLVIDDFSGGLVTSVDESMLPLPTTAYARNVDFLDSRGITRRAGYSAMTPTAITAGTVKGIHRYYQTDGDKYWVVIVGTSVWTQGGSPRAQSRKELTDANTTGTVTDLTRAYYSGGGAVSVSGTSGVVATLPSTNWLSFKQYDTSGSYRVNAAAWTNISATVTTVATTTSVTSVTIKPRARNGYSLRVAGEAARPFSPSTCDRTSIRIYGDIGGSSVQVSFIKAGYGNVVKFAYSGGLWGFFDGPTSVLISGNLRTELCDNTWHTVSFEKSGDYIACYFDNVLKGTTTVGQWSDMGSLYVNYYGSPMFADTYRINDALVDDFGTVSASWSIGATYLSATSTQYDTAHSTVVDYIDNALTVAWTHATSVSATADYIAAVTLNDKAYIATAYDPFVQYDGSSTSAVTASGSCHGAFAVELKRRIFTAGTASDPSLISYTDLDQPTDWNGGGSIRLVGKDSGGNCTGLAVWDNRILAFFASRIHTLDTTGDPSNWVNYALTTKYGTNAPKSIAVAPNGVCFLASDRSVKMYGLSSELGDSEGFITLSEAIRPTLAAIPDSMVKYAAGAVWRDRYWLACTTTVGATQNDMMLVYRFPDTEQKLPGAWTWYDSMSFATLYVTRGDEPMLVAGGYDGKLYKLDTGTDDDGSAISMTYRTAPITPGGYHQVKWFRTVHLSADSGGASQTITVTPSTDDADGSAQTVTLTSDTDIQPVRLAMTSRGRSVQYTLTSSGAGQPATVNSLAVAYNGPKQR